jgi:hypothetical protein
MYIYLDTETTGTGPDDRLCQIAFKPDDGPAVCELFNPGKPISIDAMARGRLYMNLRIIIRITIVLGFMYGFLLPSASMAQICREVSTNATVVNGNIHLRSSTPRITFETFFKFRLTQGRSLAVVQKGTRVEVLERSKVVGVYEWFRVRYCEDDTVHKGWIYAGKIGNRLYLKFDEPTNPILGLASPKAINNTINSQFLNISKLILGTAVAQTHDVVNEPVINTNPFLTVLLGFIYVSIFITALLVTRKYIFPDSALYCFLISFSILLILGFLSTNQFSDLIAGVLSSSK